ncbi:hypothetical protein RJT34_19485 [Clitoria ternatea]|uniref:Uncharacterized protein n=1 Tax=Clitoria ternatea TaxID=43366 RepID=A0AAN9P3T4_CLITE
MVCFCFCLEASQLLCRSICDYLESSCYMVCKKAIIKKYMTRQFCISYCHLQRKAWGFKDTLPDDLLASVLKVSQAVADVAAYIKAGFQKDVANDTGTHEDDWQLL